MKTGTVLVEKVEYEWSIHRTARWTGDGMLLGPALLVKPVKAVGRELILEFTLDPTRRGDMPEVQKFRMANRRLTECIQRAMAAGWDPESRGKPFFFNAGPANLS